MINKLQKYINDAQFIVAITGAGISTNSGIPDFRGPNGLYSRKDIAVDKLFDIDYFKTDSSLFYNNIGDFWKDCKNANPTAGHSFLKKLENTGKLKVIISQNIDGLHEKAGNENIINVHGDFNNFQCINCHSLYVTTEEIYNQVINKKAPTCKKCGNILKPEIVFFGEQVPGIPEAIKFIRQADLLLAIGTSLVVYPVASLPEYLSPHAKMCIINKGATPYDNQANIVIDNDIDHILSQLIL